MKFTKKLIVLMLSALMVISFIPIFSAEAVSSTEKLVPMTEAERQAKLKELDEWADKLYKMTQEYGVKPTKKAAEDDPYALARIIVKSARKLDYKGSVAHINGHNDLHIIQYKTPAEAKQAAARYSAMRGVEYAEPDIIMRADMTAHTDEFLSWGFGANYVKTFEYSENQLNGGDGSNLPQIVVAVIDTGIDFNHPYFGGIYNKTTNPNGRILPNGKDYIDNDDTPQDGAGHGSHVAGTVCDGTLPNVKILPIRVLGDDGSGSSAGVANGMEYAYLQGADIANMSLGGDGQNTTEEYIINTGTQQGTLYCVAAGNEGDDASNYSPAYVPNAFTVAACDVDKQMAYFSNFGTCVDITAPGVAIKSVKLDGGWTCMDGTSMATPHTSAAAAMVKTFNKNFTPKQIGDWLKNMADNSISYPKGGGAGFLRLCDSPAPPLPPPPTPVDGKVGFYFEENPIEEGWRWEDRDNDNFNWEWFMQSYTEDGAPVSNIPEGLGAMRSFSYDSAGGEPLTPDNWLISPPVVGGGKVTFKIVGQDPNYAAEKIGVYAKDVSATEWSGELDKFTASGMVQQFEVDLAQFTNKIIQLAFRHYDVSDEFCLHFDEVIVTVPEGSTPTNPPTNPPAPGETIGYYFEDEASIEGWQVIDGNKDDNKWGWIENDTTHAPEGHGYLISYSYKSSELNPNDWVLSPAVPGGGSVSFILKAYNSNYTEDPVGVYVSTDGGDNWGSELGYFIPTAAGVTKTVDLSAYAGQDIRIGFRHYNVNNNGWAVILDAVEVTVSAAPGSVPGDYDGNGKVNVQDAILTLRAAMGLITPSEQSLLNADTDNNGKLTVTDAIIILRMAMGLI